MPPAQLKLAGLLLARITSAVQSKMVWHFAAASHAQAWQECVIHEHIVGTFSRLSILLRSKAAA